MTEHTTIWEALRAAVNAIGAKRAAAAMWPTRADDPGAVRYLLHCMDPERNEKLGLDELVWIMREGARIGRHDVAEYLGHACLYEFRPVSPAAAESELARALDQTMQRASDLLAQIRAVRGRS